MKTILIKDTGDLNNKQINQNLEIVRVLSKSHRPLTVAEISEAVQMSLPTTKNLVSHLISQDWILNLGKKGTASGRRPELFGLNHDRFFTLGVIVSPNRLELVICDINLNCIHKEQLEFNLENNYKSLNKLIEFIRKNLAKKKLSHNQVLGIGVGINGRVCRLKGISYDYFNFMEVNLKNYLERELDLQVEIDNYTRVLGILEKENGETKNIRHALIVNLDYNLGTSLLLNGELITGQNGFAGEFRHMKFGSKKRLCNCGKLNCLETEVSGQALILDLKDDLKKGHKSTAFSDPEHPISFKTIIKAAIEGDSLSRNLLEAQCHILGEALGNIANLLNPSRIILAGEYCKAFSIIIEPIKKGLYNTALPGYIHDETIECSSNSTNVAIGSACLILRYHDLL